MTFPASGGTLEQLADGLAESRRLARNIKNRSQSLHDQSAVGDISARGIAIYADEMKQIDDRLNVLRQIPGMQQYARDQYNNQSLDIATEFTTMRNTLQTTITWIVTNLPQGARWLEQEEFVADRLVERMLNSTQTAGLRTELLALIATID